MWKLRWWSRNYHTLILWLSKNCSIWKNIVDWLNSLGYRLGYFTDVQILFGDKKFDPIVNKVIIASKYLIFKQKTKTSAVTFKKLLYFLKSESEIERGIATNNNQLKKFWGLWSPIWKSIKNPAHYIWTLIYIQVQHNSCLKIFVFIITKYLCILCSTLVLYCLWYLHEVYAKEKKNQTPCQLTWCTKLKRKKKKKSHCTHRFPDSMASNVITQNTSFSPIFNPFNARSGQKQPGNLGEIYQIKAQVRKHLREKCLSEHYQQLSFKYFVKIYWIQ